MTKRLLFNWIFRRPAGLLRALPAARINAEPGLAKARQKPECLWGRGVIGVAGLKKKKAA